MSTPPILIFFPNCSQFFLSNSIEIKSTKVQLFLKELCLTYLIKKPVDIWDVFHKLKSFGAAFLPY